MISLDLLFQACDELAENTRHIQCLAERRALDDTDAEPAVEAIAPQVILSEDIADVFRMGPPGGEIREEIALGK
jgi:hypothetical protein